MAIDPIGGAQQPASFAGMDVETALMAVQSNRANILESQLKDQIAAVQAKNDTIAKMNSTLAAFQAVSSALPSDLKPTDAISNKALGPDDKKFWDAVDVANKSGVTLPSLVSKGDLDGFLSSLKSQIDSLSNTQQMDMLRLQSLSNKRNEAYDIMTNFVKKNADNRSSIVGNMR